ncbi:MAG: VWA domain-containing protein [Treponemataceae bacterium]|nr:VWA domain-containing protein [Treponemataceae bacterium]
MNFSIERPQLLLLFLLLIPIYLVIHGLFKNLKNALFAFQNSADSKHANKLKLRIEGRVIFWGLSFICMVLALCGISWGTENVPVQKSGTSVCFVFDISYSMNAEDAGNSVETVSRLEAVSRYASSLLQPLNGSAISAVIAKGDGYVAVPLTEDFNSVSNLIDSLAPTMISAAGSSLGKGIQAAVKSFPGQSSSKPTILLFTDGDETDSGLEKAVLDAARHGFSVVLLGFGSEEEIEITAGDGETKVMTALRSTHLAEIADHAETELASAGTGRLVWYISASQRGSAAAIVNLIRQSYAGADNSADAPEKTVSYELKPVDRSPMFMWIGIACFAVGFFFAELSLNIRRAKHSVAAIIFVSVLFTSCEGSLKDAGSILSNKILWHRGEYRKATEGFLELMEKSENGENSVLHQYAQFGLATSYLMQGESQAALSKYEEILGTASPEILFAANYNAGIIAFENGDFDYAAEYFKNALIADSSSIDAKVNYELSRRQGAGQGTGSESTAAESPKNAADSSSVMENAIFSIIKESEKNRWNNTQQQDNSTSVIDY